jgi:hypothetical protein
VTSRHGMSLLFHILTITSNLFQSEAVINELTCRKCHIVKNVADHETGLSFCKDENFNWGRSHFSFRLISLR